MNATLNDRYVIYDIKNIFKIEKHKYICLFGGIMKKYIIPIIAVVLMGSFCMCVNTNNNNNSTGNKYSNNNNNNAYGYNTSSNGTYNNMYCGFNYNNSTIIINISKIPVELELRTTIGKALSTKLINTTDKDIGKSYIDHKIIYFEYNRTMPAYEGGVTIVDLSSKLKFLNPVYPHIIVDRSVFKNESEANKVKYNNKTMIIRIIRSNTPAIIKRVNNTFIIEGNSLKELDKAESRFILDIYEYLSNCNNNTYNNFSTYNVTTNITANITTNSVTNNYTKS